MLGKHTGHASEVAVLGKQAPLVSAPLVSCIGRKTCVTQSGWDTPSSVSAGRANSKQSAVVCRVGTQCRAAGVASVEPTGALHLVPPTHIRLQELSWDGHASWGGLNPCPQLGSFFLSGHTPQLQHYSSGVGGRDGPHHAFVAITCDVSFPVAGFIIRICTVCCVVLRHPLA